MARLTVSLVLVIVIASTVGVVHADTSGRPGLGVYLPDNLVERGETTTLELFVQNAGVIETGGTANDEARVTTARAVRLTLESGTSPVDIETATRPVGSVPEGVTGPLVFSVTVNESAAPGAYSLPVTVRYTYTSDIDTDDPDGPEHTWRSQTLETAVEVVVEDRPRFAVTAAEADVAVGGTGSIDLRVRNDGTETIDDATVTVRSDDPALSFGGGASATSFVGEWAPGEVRSLTLSASITGGIDARPLPLSVVVAYRDSDGNRREANPATTGVIPAAEPTFGLTDVSSTLAVGDEGTIKGTLTNAGETAIRNAVVVFSAENANVVPVETEYAVGDLEVGESATFEFDAEVTDSANAGPRQLSLSVRFRDADDEVRRSGPLDVRVEIGARRPVFAVERVSGPISAGSSDQLELRVTNAGDEPVSAVSAKLFADDPLSSSDDEAFVERLAPGESVILRFELSAAADALEKAYPLSLDFQYEDSDGDTRLSDTYDVPVDVAVGSDGGIPSIVHLGVAIGILAMAGGVWYIWRR